MMKTYKLDYPTLPKNSVENILLKGAEVHQEYTELSTKLLQFQVDDKRYISLYHVPKSTGNHFQAFLHPIHGLDENHVSFDSNYVFENITLVAQTLAQCLVKPAS